MKQYSLTKNGKDKFSRIRNDPTSSAIKQLGYHILEYLYEMGAANAEDIVLHTGISRSEVTSKLRNYEKQGLVEVIVEL